MTQHGIDVSHWQSDATIIKALEGRDFAFVKTSDGLYSDSPTGTARHDHQIQLIRDHHKIPGHYHFARHCRNVMLEAANFLARARPQPGDLLALDLEDMDGSWESRAVYALRWLDAVAQKTGAQPFWYVNAYWWNQLLRQSSGRQVAAKYPLWIAAYSQPPGHPGVDGWRIHQYSQDGIDLDIAAAGVNVSDYALPKPIPVPAPSPPAPAPPTPEEEQMLISYNGLYLLHAGKLVALNNASYSDAGTTIDGLPRLEANDAQWAVLSHAYPVFKPV